MGELMVGMQYGGPQQVFHKTESQSCVGHQSWYSNSQKRYALTKKLNSFQRLMNLGLSELSAGSRCHLKGSVTVSFFGVRVGSENGYNEAK
jgi:hypothetical protein